MENLRQYADAIRSSDESALQDLLEEGRRRKEEIDG